MDYWPTMCVSVVESVEIAIFSVGIPQETKKGPPKKASPRPNDQLNEGHQCIQICGSPDICSCADVFA